MNIHILRRNCRLPDYYQIVHILPHTFFFTILLIAEYIISSISQSKPNFNDFLHTTVFFTLLIICLICWLKLLLLFFSFFFRIRERKLCSNVISQASQQTDISKKDALKWLVNQMNSNCKQYSTIFMGGNWVVGPRGALELSQLSGIFGESHKTASGYVLKHCFGLIALTDSGQYVYLDGLVPSSKSKIDKLFFSDFEEAFDDIRDCYINLVNLRQEVMSGNVHDFLELQDM